MDAFTDKQMVVGKSGDLCLMGHAKRLTIGGKLFELFADPARRRTGDTGIDLVKDQGLDKIRLAQHGLDREHHAGQFAAGRDLGNGLGILAGIGGDQKLELIDTAGIERRLFPADLQTDIRHLEKRHFALHILAEAFGDVHPDRRYFFCGIIRFLIQIIALLGELFSIKGIIRQIF